MWYNKSMGWNKELVKYWCDHYYSLRDYELNPFEHIYFSKGEISVAGSQHRFSNYIETCDLNWEFDKVLKGLGEDAKVFKSVYLDGDEETKESEIIYSRFCKFLVEENED